MRIATQAPVDSLGDVGNAGALVTEVLSSNEEPEQTQNFAIFFHMLTRDHSLPDLIWNEQTRLELRSELELELRNYEREKRLRGSKEVAWNFQQFRIHYHSLKHFL